MVSAMTRPLLALAAALAWLAGCTPIGPDAHGLFQAPMVQIAPGVSAPSAPVVTILRTKKVAAPQSESQPEPSSEPVPPPGPPVTLREPRG